MLKNVAISRIKEFKELEQQQAKRAPSLSTATAAVKFDAKLKKFVKMTNDAHLLNKEDAELKSVAMKARAFAARSKKEDSATLRKTWKQVGRGQYKSTTKFAAPPPPPKSLADLP